MKRFFATTTLLFLVITLSTRLFPIEYEMKIFIFGFVVFSLPIITYPFIKPITFLYRRIWKR